jgi:hypothetical protein
MVALSLPIFLIVIGLILEARIYFSFTKKGIKRHVARVFAFIMAALVIFFIYVAPNPIMMLATQSENMLLRLVCLIIMAGSILQIVLRVTNEIKYKKAS